MTQHAMLARDVGTLGAVWMGLGSILGTGVFVSIGIAAGVIGPAVILAIPLAALVALCNALSSAQLAASHPVSGGTYEYGYTYLSPAYGFTAGWMFLCAKSASAATAALGFAGYLLTATGQHLSATAIALLAIAALTAIVLLGIRLSSRVNAFIVGLTVSALLAFCIAGFPGAWSNGTAALQPFFQPAQDSNTLSAFLYATALMFVAYTGYGRIATLGEEVRNPRVTIPRAIIATLVVSAALYVAVGVIAVMHVGADNFAAFATLQAAPLDSIAKGFDFESVHVLVAIGAMTAMLGVLLNLILGLSRILLAMGRRGDMPAMFAALNASRTTPTAAVIAVGLGIGGLALLGDVKLAWSFSAFTVLIYYAITNYAALRLPAQHRLYPRIFAWGGLASCLFLAFWVEWRIWLAGCALIGIGLLWHLLRRQSRNAV